MTVRGRFVGEDPVPCLATIFREDSFRSELVDLKTIRGVLTPVGEYLVKSRSVGIASEGERDEVTMKRGFTLIELLVVIAIM